MDNNQVIYRDAVFTHQASKRLAAFIDKGLGLSQQYFDAGYFAAADLRLTLVLFYWDGMEPGQMVYAAEADVVAVVGINLARVA